MEKLDEYLTIRDAAEFLGVSTNTLRNWGRDGKVPMHRNPINGYRLFKHERIAADVVEHLAAKRPSAVEQVLVGLPLQAAAPSAAIDARATRVWRGGHHRCQQKGWCALTSDAGTVDGDFESLARFNPPDLVTGADRIGWSQQRRCFMFPRFAIAYGGNILCDTLPLLIDDDVPATHLEPPGLVCSRPLDLLSARTGADAWHGTDGDEDVWLLKQAWWNEQVRRAS